MEHRKWLVARLAQVAIQALVGVLVELAARLARPPVVPPVDVPRGPDDPPGLA